MNIFKAELDTIHQNGVIGPITQFDNATLELQILTGGQVGESWNSPEFELIAMKRDMNPVREVDQDKFTILSNEDHTVRIELKEQFLTCRGTVKMQLVIKDGSRTSTTIFYLSVGQSLDAAIIESLKDIKVLDDLDEVVELVSTFEVTATNNEATRQHNEKLREVAESNRQDEFDKAQNQRDTEFEGCQNERKQAFNQSQLDNQTTFNNNESKRQSDFNKAQTSNQQTFEFNESERQTSFERNEKERQDLFNENESERSKNEIKRVKDERTRQQFETQRQEDEAKRQQKMTEFEEKATQLSDDLDNQVARVDEFVSANEEKLLGPHDKTDYMGNAHNSVKDVMDANVEFVLDEVNTVHYEGQTITATDTIERQVRSAILKGQTLVNLKSTINKSLIIQYTTFATLNVSSLKTNTEYLVVVSNKTSEEKSYYANEKLFNNLTNSFIVPPNSSITKKINTLNAFDNPGNSFLKNKITHTTNNDVEAMLIEYQEGMENWDIPYFEGMQSVRMPVLTTTTSQNLSSIPFSFFEKTTDRKYGAWTIFEFDNLFSGKIIINKRPFNTIMYFDTKENRLHIGTTVVKDVQFIAFYNPSTNIENNNKGNLLELLKSGELDLSLQENGKTNVYSYKKNDKTNILSTPSDLELRGIGDVKDTLNVNNGEKVERIGEVVLGVNESYLIASELENTIQFTINGFATQFNAVPSSIVKCNTFKYGNSLIGTTDEEQVYLGNNFSIRILKTKLSEVSINGFKQWLSQNPITVQYKLATPVVKTVDLKGQKVYSYDGTTHYTCSAAEGSLVPTLSIDVPTNLPALVSRQRVTIESQKEQIITLEQENEQLIAQNEVQDTDIALNQDAINFMLFAPSVKSISEDKGGVSTMAAYLANQILKGRLDYTLVISRYGEFKEDIDTILIAEGKQDLIK